MQRISKVTSMRIITATLLLLFTMAMPIGISAQNLTIKGIVKDKTGEAVIGASVVQKGNNSNGTITDIDGKFSLNIPADGILIFSYVGMKTQEIPISPYWHVCAVPPPVRLST